MSFQLRQTLFRSFFTSLWTCAFFAYFIYQFDADQRFTLFFLNKAVAETTIVLISLSYLLGPLCLLSLKFARFLAYKRYFGLAGFIGLVTHIVLSFMQIGDRFPWVWYADRKIGVTAAVVATFIFSALALTSKNSMITAMTPKRWKLLQRIGYVGLLLILVHLYFASSRRWGQWWAGEVELPSSLIVFCIAAFTVFLRIVDFLLDPKGTKVPATSIKKQ